MNLIRTGRILDWFVRDLRVLTRRADVRFVNLPLQVAPYRPPGLWCWQIRAGTGYPLLWRLPAPIHPIEAIAAIRGFGGMEPRSLTGEHIQPLAETRCLSWREYTAHLSRFLFVSPETVRLVWHALTPLDVPYRERDHDWDDERRALWAGAGFTGTEWHDALCGAWTPRRDRYRAAFWTEEVTGDVEL